MVAAGYAACVMIVHLPTFLVADMQLLSVIDEPTERMYIQFSIKHDTTFDAKPGHYVTSAYQQEEAGGVQISRLEANGQILLALF